MRRADIDSHACLTRGDETGSMGTCESGHVVSAGDSPHDPFEFASSERGMDFVKQTVDQFAFLHRSDDAEETHDRAMGRGLDNELL